MTSAGQLHGRMPRSIYSSTSSRKQGVEKGGNMEPSSSAGPPPGAWPPPPAAKRSPSLNNFFAKLEGDSSGFLSLLVVLVAGVVLAYILWVPFAQPAVLINDAIGEKTCADKLPGTNAMRTCAAGAAAWKMVGPLAVGVVVFLLRKRLTKAVSKLSAKLQLGARPLVAPTLATLLFLLVWAGAHSKTGGQTGIVPQKAFPAVIGVYTYVVVRYGPALRNKLANFFGKRDRLPMVVRVLITVAVPTAVSLLITNQDRVSKTAQKEQFVVLIGLVLAYLMLSPKSGEIASAEKLLRIAPAQPEVRR